MSDSSLFRWNHHRTGWCQLEVFTVKDPNCLGIESGDGGYLDRKQITELVNVLEKWLAETAPPVASRGAESLRRVACPRCGAGVGKNCLDRGPVQLASDDIHGGGMLYHDERWVAANAALQGGLLVEAKTTVRHSGGVIPDTDPVNVTLQETEIDPTMAHALRPDLVPDPVLDGDAPTPLTLRFGGRGGKVTSIRTVAFGADGAQIVTKYIPEDAASRAGEDEPSPPEGFHATTASTDLGRFVASFAAELEAVGNSYSSHEPQDPESDAAAMILPRIASAVRCALAVTGVTSSWCFTREGILTMKNGIVGLLLHVHAFPSERAARKAVLDSEVYVDGSLVTDPDAPITNVPRGKSVRFVVRWGESSAVVEVVS